MIFSPDALAGRTILVTGASSGLGAAVAEAAAACGAVIVGAGRDAARLEAVIAALPGAGHRSRITSFTDADAASELVAAAAAEAGGLDGVFHARVWS